jgi:hypothetical protein
MSTFRWRGIELPYADHAYNTTRRNERAVELPIVERWLADGDGGATLELGNVMGHYDLGPERRIVDRYEEAPGVENLDVFDLDPETDRFDQIVAISTVEHVRWDETPREPGGSRAAIEHLRSLLTPDGRMLVTVPTGCNPPLDEYLLSGPEHCVASTLVRVHPEDWVETAEVTIRPYGIGTKWADALWVGEFCS